MKQGWEIKPLSDVCNLFTDGNWIESKDQSIEGIRLLQTGNIRQGEYFDKSDKAKFISEETFKRLKCTEVLVGDILVSRLPEPVGRSCIIPDINSKMITAVDCTIIRTNEHLLPELLRYYQLSKRYLNDVDSKTTGTTRNRISRKNLGTIEIPIPPLNEQKRIVAKLDQCFEAIDKARTNMERNLQNAKELFQSKLNEIFSQKGDGWKEKKLGEVSENLDSKRIPITKNKRQSGTVPYYGASGIVDYVASHIFNEDLLLVSEDGANLLARTYPIAFSISGKTWVNNHAHVLKFKNFKSQKFVEYYLNSIKLDNYVSGMAQPKLNQKMLNSIPLPFPDIETQEHFVNIINKLKAQTQSLESNYQQELNALDELKKSILQKAFNGEL